MLQMSSSAVITSLVAPLSKNDVALEKSLVSQAPADPEYATKAWKLIDRQSREAAGKPRRSDETLVAHQEQSTFHEQQDSDGVYWWRTTGVTLAIMLEQAQYSAEDQSKHLSLYKRAVVPQLGVKPKHTGLPPAWKSFMTDHFCPLEFSWEWNRKTERPQVRYSFEPIGKLAGTVQDPLNAFAALHFVKQNCSSLAGCDLTWFNHLWGALLSFKLSTSHSQITVDKAKGFRATMRKASRFWYSYRTPITSAAPTGHKSRCFLALDLNESSITLKAYFIPGFKAWEMGKSTMTVICDAIETLPGSRILLPAYSSLMTYLEGDAVGRSLRPEIVATDCVAVAESRVKIYMRTDLTSWDSVLSIFTLGGRSSAKLSEAGLRQLRDLWDTVWNNGSGDESQLASHRTGGLLYYFELRPGKTAPAVKIYLPLRHYGRSDQANAAALQAFVRTTSRKDYSKNFVTCLENIILAAPVSSGHSVQTYLCCMIQGNELRLTSYLSPVVY